MYMDFSKAIDGLNMGILLSTLNYIGITTPFLNFFESYLEDRTLEIECSDMKSFDIKATSDVPQGSVVRPLLKIILKNNFNLQCKALSMQMI